MLFCIFFRSQMNLKRLQSCVIVFSGDLSYVFLSKTYEDLQSNAETSSYRKTNFRRGKVSAFLHRPSWDGAGEHVYIFNHDDDQLYSFKLLSLDRTVQRTRLRKIETKYCVYCNVLPTMPSTSSAHIVLDDDKTFAERTTLPMLPVKSKQCLDVMASPCSNLCLRHSDHHHRRLGLLPRRLDLSLPSQYSLWPNCLHLDQQGGRVEDGLYHNVIVVSRFVHLVITKFNSIIQQLCCVQCLGLSWG